MLRACTHTIFFPSLANSAILDALRGAADKGLHINDLTQLTGFTGSKDILPRLYDMMNRQQVEKCGVGHIWRIKSLGPATTNITAVGKDTVLL